VITAAMVGVIALQAQRRPPGTPLTWGEAFVAGLFIFTLAFMAYGVVPHLFLTFADSELQWRSDSLGIPTPFGRVFSDGITVFGRGRIMINAQVIRDVIVSGIYGVALGGNFWGWLWWQKRGKGPAVPELLSSYGRPLKKA
jgi:hypothetical protein